MYNPLAWALAEDAICNGGPGRLDRIDMKCCLHTKAPGLNMYDVARTQALTLICGTAILGFFPKPRYEPKMPVYCFDEVKTYVPEDVAVIQEASHEAGVPLVIPVAPVGVMETDGKAVPVVQTNIIEV